jgi:phage N-6-adenine-methyltransferase
VPDVGVAVNNLAAMTSSVKQDWQTPSSLVEVIRRFREIDLDPATTDANPVGANHFFTHRENGLIQPWENYGLTYVNPPYGRELGVWTRKMMTAGYEGAEIIGLVPSRTDTRWFQDNLTTARAICFWRGRLTFVGANAPAPFPSCLPYWGDDREYFKEHFSEYGWVVFP